MNHEESLKAARAAKLAEADLQMMRRMVGFVLRGWRSLNPRDGHELKMSYYIEIHRVWYFCSHF